MIVKDFFITEAFDLSDFKEEPIQLFDIPILQVPNRYGKVLIEDKVKLQDIIESIDPKYGHVRTLNDKNTNDMFCFGTCENPDLGRTISNIKTKSKFFMVDYDNGYTIEQFEKDYKDYFYLLYTSFSHTKELNKFRVIMFGNYDKPLNDRQQKTILSHAFRNADQTTLQPNRFFYLPAHKENGEYVFKQHFGKQFPLWCNDMRKFLDKQLADEARVAKRDKEYYNFHEKKNVDCSNGKAVKEYLNTPYPHKTGNGNSDKNFYRAVYGCIKNHDNKTLELVIEKARNEGWSEKEIEYKQISAQKAIENQR